MTYWKQTPQRSNLQTQLTIPRYNTDKRISTAYNLYNAYEEGLYLVHKTTRAGCTTGLVAESLNRSEQFLVVVPTNKIADKTVIADAEKYSDKGTTNIIRVLANHSCVKNEQLCKEYPDLDKLPILPLADKCSECEHFYDCPVTRVLHDTQCDGIALTYQKLAALMMASMSRPNTMAEQILDNISDTRNVVFDEIHEIQYGKATGLTVYDTEKQDKRIDLSKYIAMCRDFEQLHKVIVQFQMLMDEIKVKMSILELYHAANDNDYWKHHLSKTLKNSYCDISLKDGGDKTKAIMATYQEIIELTKNRKKYKLKMRDILDLYKILNIITNENVAVHAIRDKGYVKVQMVAVDLLYTKMLQSYMMSIQNQNKRILMTSATICSYDYGQMFMDDTRPKNITFGTGGDPMNTNSKMLILADSKRYHVIGRNSRWSKKEEILHRITTILDYWGDENCIIITLNIAQAKDLEMDLEAFGHPHSVTYYKAPEMMGVSSDARVMIAVGMANKPSNAFDVITDTKDESRILLEESVHCDTWQAWSRVKDPNGKIPSVVFALGCAEEECKNIVTWGYGRMIEIEPYKAKQKKKVNVSCELQNITRPVVNKCKDFAMMLADAGKHTLNEKVFEEKTPNLLINNIIRSFESISSKIYNKCELLELLVNRDDVFAEQAKDGSYFKVSGAITDKLLENHIAGKITIGTYTLNVGNTVKWICFDVDAHEKDTDTEEDLIRKQQNADLDKDKLCNFLTMQKIPFVLEASGSPHSYHVWIFVNPVKAAKAKEFGKLILKECKIDCELFPKQTTINSKGYGNLVKLPFATHRKHGGKSKIWINGEFTDEFDELEVGILDISTFEVKKSAKKSNAPMPKITEVRPCIHAALDKNLEEEQGHWMRIAIVREYYNFGMTNPEDLARLFENQPDYDFEYSLGKVNSIICKEAGIWRRDTLLEKCGKYVDCERCTNHCFRVKVPVPV